MVKGLKIFIGYDERQALSYNVLQFSIARRSSDPVSISPLVLNQLPIKRVGLTPFTYSRFLVPWLCDYEGWALFMDADMLVLDDIKKLFALRKDEYAVMVSKNAKRFEWASLMLFNCEKCKVLTPEFIEKAVKLHTIEWVDESQVGDIPREWNHLVGYDSRSPSAKIVHFTQGMPCYPETRDCEYAPEWLAEKKQANFIVPWVELMGTSVHAVNVNGRLMPKFLIDLENKRPAVGYENTVKKLMGGGN